MSLGSPRVVPPSFPQVELGKLVEFRRGLTYKKSDEVECSTTAVLRANNVDLATGQLDLSEIRYLSDDVNIPRSKKFVPDSLLICTASGSRAHLGKMAHIAASIDFAFGGFMGLLVPSPGLSARYLWYFSRSNAYREFLETLSPGANINNLRFDDLARLMLPLPALDEQKRIVAVLDEAFVALDRASANAEANLADSKQLRDSIISTSLEASLDHDSRRIRLSELCSIARGGSPRPIQKFLTSDPEGVNWIKISDATASGMFIESTKEKISRDGVSRSRYVVSGSFLLTNSMSFGRPYILRTNGCIHDGWLVLEPDYNLVEQEYLYYLLGSRQVFDEFDRLAAGSTVRNLNINLVSNVYVSLPTLDRQRETVASIAGALDATDKLLTAYQDQATQNLALRQSLLQAAFSGHLS